MKRCFLFSLMLILCAANARACDICGSGAGGGYMGLLPGFRNKFVSVRYSFNSLKSHLGPRGTSTYLTSVENYRMLELWGAANIGKHYRIAAFLPVNFIERSNGMGQFNRSGLGDISMIGYRLLFSGNRTNRQGAAIQQSLWGGLGIKLPTGDYNPEEANVQNAVQNTFQLGTGSIDLGFHLLYDLQVQDWGLNLNVSYKLNTLNKYDYQYGNKITGNALLYYQWRPGNKWSLKPNTGLMFERSAKDRNAAKEEVWATGGYTLMGTLGLEMAFDQIGMGMNWQSPWAQRLGEEKLRARDRGMIYLSYSF